MSEKKKVSLAQGPAPDSYGVSAVPPPEAPTWEVPVSAVTLPSRGLVYPVESPLHCRESVEIRAMTAKEEDILTSTALIRQGKVMSALIKSCLIDKSIDPDEMLVGDRNALLIAIRSSGYGDTYSSELDCPSCGKSFEQEFDLKLPIDFIGEEPDEVGVNSFSFELPVTGARVVFRLLTGAQERDLTIAQERIRKVKGVQAVESNVTMRLQHCIVSINGERDGSKLQRMIRTLPAKDSLHLRSHIDKIAPGLVTTKEVTCPMCGEETEVDMPIGADFFWPDTSR